MNRLTIGEKTAQVSHAGSVNSTMKTLAPSAPSTAEWGRTKVDAYSCAITPRCSARRRMDHDAAKVKPTTTTMHEPTKIRRFIRELS
jgi:hypothetical protein